MSASNIEIAQEAQKSRMRPISEIARKLKIEEEELELFGRFKAKLAWSLLDRVERVPEGKLILVTAMSPTPAGEGKTTTTVGLGDALTALGHRAMICLREPSIGPVFGIKGGAAGGGYSQILPMEDINLHFTGDFHAIQIANNLLAALIDNHLHHGNALGIDVRKVVFKRVLDVSDRSLRQTTIGLGGSANGYPRQDGFDIVVASEVMAILCLATSLKDLRERLGKIVVAQTRDGKPVSAADLMAHGAMAVLLKDALKPNLVQSIEGTPALVHGGPFANIAHGCNSVIATRTALRLADYVVTEAGFGADLGAEKFIDIKCRKSGLKPAACVLVVTVRAIRHHGGPDRSLEVGIADVERHLQNMRDHFGLPIVVAINHFSADAPADLTWIQTRLSAMGVETYVARHWAEGGKGALALARAVVTAIEQRPPDSPLQTLYGDDLPLWEKMRTIAWKIYGAADISADPKVMAQIADLEKSGYGYFPVCVAKTQYSFSTDPKLLAAPTGHIVHVREVRLSAGAGFVVMVCGDMMTMPGLPRSQLPPGLT